MITGHNLRLKSRSATAASVDRCRLRQVNHASWICQPCQTVALVVSLSLCMSVAVVGGGVAGVVAAERLATAGLEVGRGRGCGGYEVVVFDMGARGLGGIGLRALARPFGRTVWTPGGFGDVFRPWSSVPEPRGQRCPGGRLFGVWLADLPRARSGSISLRDGCTKASWSAGRRASWWRRP